MITIRRATDYQAMRNLKPNVLHVVPMATYIEIDRWALMAIAAGAGFGLVAGIAGATALFFIITEGILWFAQ